MLWKNAYITETQFERVLKVLNVENMESEDKQELLDTATGDMESDLVERFVVPLVGTSSEAFSLTPKYSQQKILTMLKAKIRQIIGLDKNKNLVIDSTQKFIDVHKITYTDCLKVFMDAKKTFGFMLQPQAQGAVEPVQSVGLARADNKLHVAIDPDAW